MQTNFNKIIYPKNQFKRPTIISLIKNLNPEVLNILLTKLIKNKFINS